MHQQYSLDEIAHILGGQVIGDGSTVIRRVASLSSAGQGDIAFISDSKYLKSVATCQASAFVLREKDQAATALPRIIVDNPYAYFAKISPLLNPPDVLKQGVAPTAVISNSAQVSPSCSIGEHVYIGERVSLGANVVIKHGSVIEDGTTIADNTVIESNVTIKHHTVIGRSCHVFSGAVIGSDGFGYAEENGVWIKIPQVGQVVIHDNVDVGANTTIDRGALDNTVICEGVKLDNLIQIGHNCVIGAHTVIAGCVGVAGSTKIGQHCKIGGAAMILGHLEIVDGVTISPGTMITRSIREVDTYTALMPFQAHKSWLNTAAKIRQLDSLTNKLKQIEKDLEDLKKSSSL
jgi:UDP-3-O-[3-hydroxymyristoyl] glucosamine N-acyltransferase